MVTGPGIPSVAFFASPSVLPAQLAIITGPGHQGVRQAGELS